MESVIKFKEQLVKITVMDNDKFGHYPFQMFTEDNQEKTTLKSLALGGDVNRCYTNFATDIKICKRVYMSLDFPSVGDINKDFVAVFSFENNELDLFAIPYCIETGNSFDIIKSGETINSLKMQIKEYIKSPKKQ